MFAFIQRWVSRHGDRLRTAVRRVVVREASLRRTLKPYARDYNEVRTHRPLDQDAPEARPIQVAGMICSHPVLGGLHHHYVQVLGFQ
jgi:hypothetical protein